MLRAPAKLPRPPRKYSAAHTLALTQSSVPLASQGCFDHKSFAASAHQSQTPQAGASSSPRVDSPGADILLESPQQQATIPADQYSYSGTITEQYDVKRKPVFAVVELGPTQFKVTPDDLVYSEKLKGVDVGDEVSLNRVLLLGNTATTVIGRPHVPGATVTAVVEVQLLAYRCHSQSRAAKCCVAISKLPNVCRSNSSTAKCSFSRSDAGRILDGSMATDRCAYAFWCCCVMT